MNKKFLSLIVVSMFLTLMALLVVMSKDAQDVYGAVNLAEASISTTTPNVANNTVLCSSGGALDSLIAFGAHSGYLWILDATSTTHTDFATTSAILAELPVGYGTTTGAIYGVQAKRGIIVNYTGTGSTTITYSCGA